MYNDRLNALKSQIEADEWEGVNGLETAPDEFGDVFVTTDQITAEDHALMQRRLQEHVDSGISKTINLPADADLHDVADAYKRALSRNEVGKPAKGITVYRDGSRDEQVKSTTADMNEAGSSDGIEAGVPDPIELYQSDEWSDEEVEQYVNEVQALVNDDEAEICPECEDGVLQAQEGCSLCTNCGFSPCS